MKPPIPYPLLITGLAALTALLGFVSMTVGPATAGTFELLDMLAHEKADVAWMIMREVRLPRTLLAMLVGMTLGMAGAALQGFLRNPLADPGIVGVSPAASLGAVLALYTGLSTQMPLALPLMGILGALLCALLLQGLARRGGVLTLVLAGVAVSSLCAALMSLADQTVASVAAASSRAALLESWLIQAAAAAGSEVPQMSARTVARLTPLSPVSRGAKCLAASIGVRSAQVWAMTVSVVRRASAFLKPAAQVAAASGSSSAQVLPMAAKRGCE